MCMTDFPSTKKHVLLIDDDEDEKYIFELAAAKSDHPITVDHVTTCDKKKLATLAKPDFIFLDINMPEHDGFVWLKSLREKLTEPIPVIMYSTSQNPENIHKAYRMGASLFVTKPDTSTRLSLILKQVFDLDWSNPVQVAEENFTNKTFHIAH
jgi:CheY-like chemotaxis protein